MVVKCELIGVEAWYSTGQTITGKICISLDDRTLIKAMCLKINGYAYTEWDSSKQKPQKECIVKAREDFIAATNFLVGSEVSSPIMFASGNYSYNFSCDIPDRCPSSYNSIHGHVRYEIKVILDLGNKIEEILSESFHVIKPFDLRPQTPVLKLPVELEVFESKCFCECWKTPLCLYINIPQGGFVPGETISVYARLINDGKVPLKSIAISFNQIVIYTSKIPRKVILTERLNMVQNLCSLVGIEPLREFLERIPVPNVPPTCETDCTILQISYEIEVSIDQAKGNRKIVARIPVLIGTIPLEIGGSSEEYNEGKTDEIKEDLNPHPSAVISSTSMETLNSEKVSQHPPEVILSTHGATSFQEAAFMTSAKLNKEDKHILNKDISGFKPKYLYYEISEDIEMSPTTMEITKEITIAST